MIAYMKKFDICIYLIVLYINDKDNDSQSNINIKILTFLIGNE